MLGRSPYDLCLLTLGINTAYRANELLSLRVRQVRGLEVGDVIDGAQSKSDRSSAGDAQGDGNRGGASVAGVAAVCGG